MELSAKNMLYASLLISIAMTFVTGLGAISLYLSHVSQNQGIRPMICFQSDTTVEGGFPMAWINDTYRFCGGYADRLRYVAFGLAADLVFWFVIAFVSLHAARYIKRH